MVKPVVYGILGILIGFWLSTTNLYADDRGRAITISPKEVELGKAVTLVIRGREEVQAFELWDKKALLEHFALDIISSASDRLRIKLYAYDDGEFKVPEIRIGKLYIPETTIKVSKNPEITVNWGELPEQGYAQQMFFWPVEVGLENSAWRVELIEPGLDAKMREKWSYRLQKKSGVKIGFGDEMQYRMAISYRFDDLLPPLKMVTFSMPAPQIKVRSPNGEQWVFYAPDHSYRLQPLPSFFPVSLLVGRLNWQASFLESSLVLNEVNYWQWELSAKDVDNRYLKELANQLQDGLEKIQEIEWLTAEESTEELMTEEGLQQTVKLLIPFRPQSLFWLQPEMTLRYFDPETGKLQSETIPARWHISLPYWLWIVSQALMALIILLLAVVLGAMLWQNWRLKRLRIAILRAERASDFAEALYCWQADSAPLKILGMENLQPNMSLGQWLEWYRKSGSATSSFEAAERMIEQLQKSLYASQNGPDDFQTCQQSLLRWLEYEKWYLQYRWLFNPAADRKA